MLLDQIEQKKMREAEEKKKKRLDDQYFEDKLARERAELAMRERLEKEV